MRLGSYGAARCFLLGAFLRCTPGFAWVAVDVTYLNVATRAQSLLQPPFRQLIVAEGTIEYDQSSIRRRTCDRALTTGRSPCGEEDRRLVGSANLSLHATSDNTAPAP